VAFQAGEILRIKTAAAQCIKKEVRIEMGVSVRPDDSSNVPARTVC
jgi:hypothetical protein